MYGIRVEAGQAVRALFGFATDIEHPADALEQLADQAAAAVNPPRKSGTLAAGIFGEVTQGRAAVKAVVIYAGPINHGWLARNIAPVNFMAAADAVLDLRAPLLLQTDLYISAKKRGLT